MKLAALLVVLSLALCGGVLASTPETVITVNVTNQYDKPVENAAVILDFLGSHQVMKLGKRKTTHWEAHTNLEGVAHFPPVPAGTIQLQVVTKQYQTYGNKFDVDSGEKTIDVKLNPPQKQYSAHPPLKPPDTKPPDPPKP